jgi:hypothetical protein
MFAQVVASAVILSSTTIVAGQSHYRSSENPYHYQHVSFPKPDPIINPMYYADILSKFSGCKAHKCSSNVTFTDNISDSIAQLGEYTSCVTGCAAEQMYDSIKDYKKTLGKAFEIGSARLIQAREYLSGEGEYDVLGQATRIGESCCLPTDYFIEWKKILIAVEIFTKDSDDKIYVKESKMTVSENSQIPRMISVVTYLDLCTDPGTEVDADIWTDILEVNCNFKWVKYLQLLQHNIGHLIMAPKTNLLAPKGSCDTLIRQTSDNPRAEAFLHDVCIAIKCNKNGVESTLDVPIIKPTIDTRYTHEGCPSDLVKNTAKDVLLEIVYDRAYKNHVDYYTVTDGLPSEIQSDSKCQLKRGLAAKPENEDFFTTDSEPSQHNMEAAKNCPYGGLLEFCNMKQYATFLQRQLFDVDTCQIVDMRDLSSDNTARLSTLACLYKTVSMKCDCMEAVLSCYEHQFNFKDAMAGTIGKAASILCGFILCLRPKVYTLFGGQHAIEQSNIMRGLLNQVGLSVPSVSQMPPASFAFLAFGIGMVAFVATKVVSKKTRTVNHNEGYTQFI